METFFVSEEKSFKGSAIKVAQHLLTNSKLNFYFSQLKYHFECTHFNALYVRVETVKPDNPTEKDQRT